MRHAPLLLALVALVFLASISACGGGDDAPDGPSGATGTGEPSPAASPDDGPSAAPEDTGEDGAEPDGANLLVNPGFEDGDEGWAVAGVGYTVSGDESVTGSSSALLELRDDPDSPTFRSYTATQEITPDEFPAVLSGNYLVTNWEKTTPDQYIEITVVVFGGGANFAPCPDGNACPNYQLRYVLAGAATPPVDVVNGRFVFVSKEEPVLGEWVYFERDLARDFREAWGAPENFEKIRVIFEVRYDNREADAPLEADVYLDDVYIGPGG